MANDVERQPGPIITALTVNLLLILLGISLNKMKTLYMAPVKPRKIPFFHDEKENWNKSVLNKSKKPQTEPKSNFKYLQTLMLLAGDIHPNPGPVQQNLCLNCKTDIKLMSVTCSTCRGWSHLDCKAKPQDQRNSSLLDQSFEWLCPNPTCNSNYHSGLRKKLHTTPNRYKILDSITITKKPGNKRKLDTKPSNASEVLPQVTVQIDTSKKGKKVKPRKKQKATKPEEDYLLKNVFKNLTRAKINDLIGKDRCKLLGKKEEVTNIFDELPKISSKDYIGKDTCNTCLRTIARNSRSVKCTKCERWTHVKCSDVSNKEYNKKYKLNRSSKWNCSKCRTGEDINYNIFSKSLCSQNQLPDEWDQIVKGKRNDEEIILHFNARSIIDKEDELSFIANNIKPAVIFLTETWMDDSCPKGTSVPENYSIIRKDRSSEYKQKYGKTNGGGVAILVRKGVKIKTETSFLSETNEILWCTMKLKASKHLIGLIYRASYTDLLKPDIEGNTEMEELLQKTVDNNLMLIGDLNCDTKKMDCTKDTRTLMTLAEEYKLKQLIQKPTRFSENTATTIDHIWVRNDSLVRKAGTCEGLSDHCGIYGYIREISTAEQDEEVICRNFKSFNVEDYTSDITHMMQESNFRNLINQKDINAAFNTWIGVLKEAANIHAPWKTFKPKRKQTSIPWFSTELKEVTKTKNMYLKLYRMYNRSEDQEMYRISKNKQTHLKRKCKREYYTNKINEYVGDSRKMWSILKDVTNYNYKEDITPDIVNKDTANRFNKFFANVGIQVQKKLNISIDQPKLNREGVFKFHEETSSKIEDLIKRIRPNVATGHDELSARLIKAATPAIIEDLKDLLNLSYETKTFPDQLKKAIVKALHKKGGNNDPAQYRPVSILTIISKVFERSAVDQLVEYYNLYNKLNHRQHAYRKYHSTTTSLFELVETIKKHIDDGNLVGMAALDLSKAFDSLAHNLILKKLDDMGLNESATSWIQSYLSRRKQTVKFGKIVSEEEIVESGVPQGSILGPLLFITCTNNIVEELKDYDIFTYADDMQIIIKGKNVKSLGEKLEKAIEKANEYYNKNSLLCNPTKTEIMLLGTKIRLSKAQELKVKVTNGLETKYLTGETSMKLLGVHIDQSLDWNKHTSSIKQRATNSIRNLHRVNKLIPMKQQRILYSSLVTPHFSYADTIWNNCGKVNSNKIQQAQNFAVKSMLGVSKYSSSTQALKKLELLPLAEKRKINIAVQVKKSLTGKAPENIQQLYMQQLSYEDSRAAFRGDLRYPQHNLTQYEHGPLYTSIKTWNAIPLHLRDNNLSNFKKDLQKYQTGKYLAH